MCYTETQTEVQGWVRAGYMNGEHWGLNVAQPTIG